MIRVLMKHPRNIFIAIHPNKKVFLFIQKYFCPNDIFFCSDELLYAIAMIRLSVPFVFFLTAGFQAESLAYTRTQMNTKIFHELQV